MVESALNTKFEPRFFGIGGGVLCSGQIVGIDRDAMAPDPGAREERAETERFG